jgi:hypothetical protein
MAGTADAFGEAAGAVGGIIGYAHGGDQRDKAARDYQNAIDAYLHLNPEIKAQQAGSSAYNGISVDPSTRDAQLQALQQLQNVYKSGGMDNTYRAQMAAANQDAGNTSRAMNAAVQNNAAQRGLASSGQSIAAQRSNAQASANQAAMMNAQALAGAQQRQMGAIGAAGQLGGQMRGQDFGQAAQRADANDAISRFNANQRQTASQASYLNGLGRAQGLQSAYGNQAGQLQNQADNYTNMGYGLGKGAGASFGQPIDQSHDAAKSFMSSGAMTALM